MGARSRGRAVAAHQVRAAHERAREDRGARLAGREGLIGGVVARLRRIGVAVGFFAGMLGIGGGAIMVPLLVMLFEAQGLPKAHVLHLAVGTGMATILFTSVASVRAHAARGAIRWDIARRITPGILLGGLAGSWIASFIPTAVFAAIFTGVIYIAATNLLLDRKPRASREPPGRAGMFVFGFLVS